MTCREHEIMVKVSVYLTDEDVADLMCTAIEGGIGYWACLDNTGDAFINAPKEEPVSETAAKIILNGGGVTFLEDEDRSQSWTLTLEKLLNGVKMFIEEDNRIGCVEGTRVEMAYIDANDADSIIQYALFGEQIYA